MIQPAGKEPSMTEIFVSLLLLLPDMRKCVVVWPSAAEIYWVCGNFRLAAVNFSLICFVKLKYYSNCSFKCTFEPCKRYFQCRTLVCKIEMNIGSEHTHLFYAFFHVCWNEYAVLLACCFIIKIRWESNKLSDS